MSIHFNKGHIKLKKAQTKFGPLYKCNLTELKSS